VSDSPSASASPVRYEERDAIAILTLDRPEKLNTLTDAVVQGVADGIDAATHSRQVRAIVLRGEGRVFTAGYDLTAGGAGGWESPYDAPGPTPRDGAWDPVRDYQFMNRNVERFMKIWHCPKPVIGQIHGFAVGGATDLVLCCDQLIMADDAFIGYAPSRVYGTPTTMIWVYRLGLEHAKQFLLTGDPVTAADAYRMGLVNEVVAPGALEDRALAFAARLAAGAPLAVRYTKQAVNKLVKDALNTAFDTSTALEIVTLQSEDHREALAALREKREPVFRGR